MDEFDITEPSYDAGIAQLVEHPTCNRTVVGSIPTASIIFPNGGVA
jgi:hypothetical protein